MQIKSGLRGVPLACAVWLVALTALARPASGAASRVRRAEYVTGEALVCFADKTPNDRVQAAMLRQRVTIVKAFEGSHLYRVRFPRGVTTPVGVRRFLRETDVAFCHPNYRYHAVQTFPDDPRGGDLWGLHNTGQEEGRADADIDAPEAWDLTRGSRDVVVAVIDSGVDYAHPDLRGNIWTNPGETPGDGIDNDNNGYVDDIHGWDAQNDDGNPLDDNGHGTHVAGTIGASGNNGAGVVGVNWQVSIIGVKFLDAEGGGSTAEAIEALDYVHRLKDRGVNVIATNNSWGGVPEADRALREAIARSNSRGILFVAAAGNDGYNNDSRADYPSNYDLPNVISVAATDRNDRLADFSNYGRTTVDLAAPGVEILSTVPRSFDQTTPYRFFSGTSMATPHVTGAIALLRAHSPDLSYLQIKDRLLTTGDPLSAVSGRTVTGRRLNVYNALTNDTPDPGQEGPELLVQTTAGRAYRLGTSVTVRVRSLDPVTRRPVAGATVRMVIQTAAGDLFEGEGTTAANGYSIFRFRTLRGDGRGIYIATAGVERAGYSPGTDYATFIVF